MGDQVNWDKIRMIQNGDFEDGVAWWNMDWDWTIHNGKAWYNYFIRGFLWTEPNYLSIRAVPHIAHIDIEAINNARIRLRLGEEIGPWFSWESSYTWIFGPPGGEDVRFAVEAERTGGEASAVIDNVQLSEFAPYILMIFEIYYREQTLTDVVSETETGATLRVCSITDKTNVLIKAESG